MINGVQNAQDLAQVIAYRTNKQASLRKTAHRFPDFIRSK